jgi:hypothetical protein
MLRILVREQDAHILNGRDQVILEGKRLKREKMLI